MRRFTATAMLLLFAALSVAGSTKQLTCSLTGKKIDKCCCEQNFGKLYCTPAKKTIEKCCCESTR